MGEKWFKSSDKKATLSTDHQYWEGPRETGLTFHLLDTPQRVFQRVDGAGLALVPLFRWKVPLQLLQCLEELLLCLCLSWLFAAVERTWDRYTCVKKNPQKTTRSHQRCHALESTTSTTQSKTGGCVKGWGDLLMKGLKFGAFNCMQNTFYIHKRI